MQVMDNLDSGFWGDQENHPIMLQQLFRMGRMHSLIMKEMVT